MAQYAGRGLTYVIFSDENGNKYATPSRESWGPFPSLADINNPGNDLNKLAKSQKDAIAGGAAIEGSPPPLDPNDPNWKKKQPESFSSDDIIEAAQAPDRNGMSKTGRALQKHGSRGSKSFKYTSQKASDLNREGLKIVRDILGDSRARVIQKPKIVNGQKEIFTEIRQPSGRGIILDKLGQFRGFLEP